MISTKWILSNAFNTSSRFARFWQELKRRNVIKVLAWYTGVAVVLIGLASDVAGPLNLPDWAHRMILILLIVGFPLTLIISWIFDITPEGLQKTPALDVDRAGKKDDSQWANDPSYDGSIAVLPFQDMSPEGNNPQSIWEYNRSGSWP